MEKFINESDFKDDLGDEKISKVLIATIYNPDPVLLACNRLGPDRLILLIDNKPNEKQEHGIKVIKESLGRVIDVKQVKCAVYDLVSIASKCVEIIDMQPQDDVVYVNVTAGRKTKALGLLYAAYARCNRVKKIAYNPEEDKSSVVYLPKLCFKLNESQKKILQYISDGYKGESFSEMAGKVGISQAMLYRTIDELKDMDFVDVEDGLKLTDAGKIARL